MLLCFSKAVETWSKVKVSTSLLMCVFIQKKIVLNSLFLIFMWGIYILLLWNRFYSSFVFSNSNYFLKPSTKPISGKISSDSLAWISLIYSLKEGLALKNWYVWTLMDFIFMNCKGTADGDCNHEIKRHLLLGRKPMTNLDSIFKSRDITLPTKVCLVKAMVFPVVMYGYESWTIKMAEHQRIDAFELWCWRRLLRVSCTARISNQSVLKEINPEYSLGGMMLKLKLQYFGHLMQRPDSLEKPLMLGKIDSKKRRRRRRMR